MLTTASITLRAANTSGRAESGTLLDRGWRFAIERAARRQKQSPPGAPLWHFLTRPASIAYTNDGELALELGDPPLVLISSDAALLPELYLELEVMRYGSQLCRMTDRQRQHQARIYTAGAYLADALEQLGGGLRCALATFTPEDWRRLVARPTDRLNDRNEVLRIRADRFRPRADPAAARARLDRSLPASPTSQRSN